jgi:hypothetical protein
MPTKQETFDTVVRHLKKQGKPAIQCGSCRYRTVDGLMCAAGVLIPEGRYRANLEGCSLGDVGACNGSLAFDLDNYDDCDEEYEAQKELLGILEDEGHDVYLVTALQWVHDRQWPIDSKVVPVEPLRIVANHFALSPAVIDE